MTKCTANLRFQIVYRCMANFMVSINKSEIACSENPPSAYTIRLHRLLIVDGVAERASSQARTSAQLSTLRRENQAA